MSHYMGGGNEAFSPSVWRTQGGNNPLNGEEGGWGLARKHGGIQVHMRTLKRNWRIWAHSWGIREQTMWEFEVDNGMDESGKKGDQCEWGVEAWKLEYLTAESSFTSALQAIHPCPNEREELRYIAPEVEWKMCLNERFVTEWAKKHTWSKVKTILQTDGSGWDCQSCSICRAKGSGTSEKADSTLPRDRTSESLH